MKKLIVICILVLFSESLIAQSENDLLGTGIDLELMDESMLDDESSSTFILDNTKTKIGRDLYETFYQLWSSLELDSTARKQLKVSLIANPELVIEIEEIPSPGLSNMAVVKIDDIVIWQDFVQTRPDAMTAQLSEAIRQVIQYFISFQEIQNQLGSDDQSGSGIF